jgi:hypothetical protein
MTAKRPNLRMLQTEHDALALQFKNAALKRRIEILAKYDATAPSTSNRKRKSAYPETMTEEDVLPMYERQSGIKLTRDLDRNYSNGRALLNQLVVNVVGVEGKVQVNTDDDFGAAATTWFNTIYAKNCDFRGDCHLSELFGLIVRSVPREGDILVVFDDFLEDSGRLMFFEADQIVEVSDSDWQTNAAKWGFVETVPAPLPGRPDAKQTVTMKQKAGVVYDRLGRPRGYLVTAKHGMSQLPAAEVTPISRESARLLMRPWRVNQLRGTAEMLTCVNDMEDIYEMRAKELQTAKVAAAMAGVVTTGDGGALESAIMRGGGDPNAIVDGTAPTSQQGEQTTYDRLGALTGGYVDYLEPGDKFELLKIDRPNVNAIGFHDHVLQSAGSGLGLARAYAQLKADSSYTAFRGEMLLSWSTFYMLQKWLERRAADWIAGKAIGWAIRKRLLVAPTAGWENRLSWSWPEMPQVDPEKETNANEAKLQNGLTDFSAILGPNWRDTFKALGEQIKFAEEQGLPLAILLKIITEKVKTQTGDMQA